VEAPAQGRTHGDVSEFGTVFESKGYLKVTELLPFLEPGASLKLDAIIKFMVVGSICAGVVTYVYRLISPKKADEIEFGATLFLLTISIGLLVSIIKQAPAISFGLFGAMSIVRFRAQIKKSRRMVFLFMATVIGVCCGAGEYLVTVFGTIMLAGVAYLMYGRYDEAAAATVDVEPTAATKPDVVAASIVPAVPAIAGTQSAVPTVPNLATAKDPMEQPVKVYAGGRRDPQY